MKSIMTMAVVAALLLGATAVWAEDEPAPPKRENRHAEMKAKILEKFDANGDGELDEEERAAAREAMGGRRGKKGPGPKGDKDGEGVRDRDGKRGGPPPGIIEQFDADGDGKLNEEERAAAKAAFEAKMAERKAEMEAHRAAILEEFDLDKDGKLNEEERAAAHAAMKERMEAKRAELLEKYDIDEDGKLSEIGRASCRERV